MAKREKQTIKKGDVGVVKGEQLIRTNDPPDHPTKITQGPPDEPVVKYKVADDKELQALAKYIFDRDVEFDDVGENYHGTLPVEKLKAKGVKFVEQQERAAWRSHTCRVSNEDMAKMLKKKRFASFFDGLVAGFLADVENRGGSIPGDETGEIQIEDQVHFYLGRIQRHSTSIILRFRVGRIDPETEKKK